MIILMIILEFINLLGFFCLYIFNSLLFYTIIYHFFLKKAHAIFYSHKILCYFFISLTFNSQFFLETIINIIMLKVQTPLRFKNI